MLEFVLKCTTAVFELTLTLSIPKVHQKSAVFNPKISFLAAMALNGP